MSNDIIPDWTITSNTHLLRSRWRDGGWKDGEMENEGMEDGRITDGGWRLDDGRMEVGGDSGADGDLRDNSKAQL